MRPSPIRFLFVVAGPSWGTWTVAAVLVGYGAYLEWLAPAAFGQVLAIAIFLQLFAASTGFRARLRSGHFDPLLVAWPSRWKVAGAHWMVSNAAGWVVWLVLATVELFGHPRQLPSTLVPATVVLLVYTSTVGWALSAVFGRLSGALIWLTTIFALNVMGTLATLRASFIAHPTSAGDMARSILTALAVPPFLVIDPGGVSGAMLTLMGAATALAWILGASAIRLSEAALVQP